MLVASSKAARGPAFIKKCFTPECITDYMGLYPQFLHFVCVYRVMLLRSAADAIPTITVCVESEHLNVASNLFLRIYMKSLMQSLSKFAK